MKAKWSCPLQKIDLSRRDSQGLGERQVRSLERYGRRTVRSGAQLLHASRTQESNDDGDDDDDDDDDDDEKVRFSKRHTRVYSQFIRCSNLLHNTLIFIFFSNYQFRPATET